ncbi:hypothetical protein AAU57_13195 [Nonlabens sp. YIK11]|nr:hypothetical protein AAU57_13195 [Nonlabens sp. YIK11]
MSSENNKKDFINVDTMPKIGIIHIAASNFKRPFMNFELLWILQRISRFDKFHIIATHAD